MSGKKSRRSFFKTAASGGVLLSSATKVYAKRRPYKRRSPSSLEMIEVGIVTCGKGAHVDNIWGLYLNPPLEDYEGGNWPRTTGMVMTTVWDHDKNAAKSLAKRYDVNVAKNYYDMVDKVDAVIIGSYPSIGRWPQLSKPYLEAGIPTLINRPFAVSLKDAKQMIEKSKKHRAPLYVPSAYETRFETQQLRHELQALLDDGAEITAVCANQSAREYPGHGTHGVYNLHTILNPKVTAVSLYAESWRKFNSAYMSWRCGQKAGQDYYVCLHMTHGNERAWAMVLTTKGKIQTDIKRAGSRFHQLQYHNYYNMFEFAKMIETGVMPQTHEFIMEKTTTFLTGFYSHMEKNGALVNCADLPEDWRSPETDPDRIPDEVFQ